MKPLPAPPPEEPSEDNIHLLEIDFVWSTLASRLTGNADYDHAIIKGFSEATRVPVTAVIAKIRMHFRPGNKTIN
jgi:hypothetical protein